MKFRNEAGAMPQSHSNGLIQGPVGNRFDDGTPSNVAARLPRLAQGRLKRLSRQHDDARDLLHFITNRIQDAQQDRMAAAARVAACTGYDRGYVGGAANHPAMAHAKAELAAAEQHLKELDQRLEDLNERAAEARAIRQPLSQILRTIDAGVAALPASATLKDFDSITPKLRKGESAADAVTRLREEIAKARARRAATEAAPLPFNEAAPLARVQLAELAERGRPNCYELAEAGLPIRWPTMPLQVDLLGAIAMPAGDQPGHQIAGIGHGQAPDAVALFAWLFQDQLAKAIDAELKECCGGDGLSRADRQRKLAEIDAEILASERDECALIESVDLAIPYRAEASWLAVLGIEAPAARSDQ